MNYIENIANEFVRFYFTPQLDSTRSGKVVDKAKEILYDIDDEMDKAQFIYKILEVNTEKFNQHLLKCEKPDVCSINKGHEEFRYKLTQELNRLGIKTDENVFDIEEKVHSDIMVDNLITHLNDLKKDIQDLKDGHQIIYDDLIKELEELKTFYIMGKKPWWKLFSVELAKMVASGIIDETVVKEILQNGTEYIENGLPLLKG